MNCPDCGERLMVYRTTPNETTSVVNRERRCTKCQKRFLTTERITGRIK